MNGNSIALDTSVAIDVLADRAEALTSQSVTEFLLPVPVVGELRYGALNSRRAEENLAEGERLVARCRVLDVTLATAEVYARIRLNLQEEQQADSGKRPPEGGRDSELEAFEPIDGVEMAICGSQLHLVFNAQSAIQEMNTKAREPPATVCAYREVYARDPRGWPPA